MAIPRATLLDLIRLTSGPVATSLSSMFYVQIHDHQADALTTAFLIIGSRFHLQDGFLLLIDKAPRCLVRCMYPERHPNFFIFTHCTRIFEPPEGGEEDCLRITLGKIPKSKTGQVESMDRPLSLPFSPHYATVLAELARERGFDGYLLNFECALSGGPEQMRDIAAWITVLQSEILDKVGPHGETIWYFLSHSFDLPC